MNDGVGHLVAEIGEGELELAGDELANGIEARKGKRWGVRSMGVTPRPGVGSPAMVDARHGDGG